MQIDKVDCEKVVVREKESERNRRRSFVWCFMFFAVSIARMWWEKLYITNKNEDQKPMFKSLLKLRFVFFINYLLRPRKIISSKYNIRRIEIISVNKMYENACLVKWNPADLWRRCSLAVQFDYAKLESLIKIKHASSIRSPLVTSIIFCFDFGFRYWK